jgi:hypothetical protein
MVMAYFKVLSQQLTEGPETAKKKKSSQDS